MKSSRLKGFYNFSVKERIDEVARWAGLSEEEKEVLYSHKGFTTDVADKMIENVLGIFPHPLGIAPNFRINGKDYLVPMAVEESSVVAAASNAARFLREGDGMEAIYHSSLMIGQIQFMDVPNLHEARKNIFIHEEEILKKANDSNSVIIRKGGGAKRVDVRLFEEEEPKFLVVHLWVDVLDAMGANAINSMCEKVAPYLGKITGGRSHLKILSNLSENRLVTCTARIHLGHFSEDEKKAEQIAQGIEEASIFAERDPYRAVTHNKGVMNGVDSVLLATGQDFRAVEAAAHAYACRKGKYSALALWRFHRKQRYVEGKMEIPMSVGTVGGITQVHPTVKLCLKILDVKSAGELAQVAACVGLAQNFAAIMALSTEGIQRGHMSLHSRNVAASVGAQGEEIDEIAQTMVETGEVHAHKALELLHDLRMAKSIQAAHSAGVQNNHFQEVVESLFRKGSFKVSDAQEALNLAKGVKNGPGNGKGRK